MSNNYEDIIKNEVNKYMEQIEVPKNIGGIIMEDFEKIKREEEEAQNYNYDEAVNKKKGLKNKKALKISIAAVSAVVLVGAGVFVGSRFLGRSTTTINNNGAQNSNMATNNEVFDEKITIRKNQIENFGKLNQFLRNVHNGTEDEIEIETYLEPEWELVASTKEPSKLYVKYDGTKYNVKYDIAEGMRYSKQTVEGEFSDILIRKTTSQSAECIEMELTFYRINNNKLEILPVFFFKLSDVGIDPAKSSVKDLLAQDYKTYKKMNDEISNEVYDGLYNLEKDLRDKFGETVYKQKLQQLSIKDESSVINLIKDKETGVQQELVTDAYTYNGTTKDGNNTSVSYRIPKININSSDATKINNEIDEKITSEAKKLVSEINNGSGSWVYKIFYNYYINDNILSIIIESDYDANDAKAYFVYNIDINTGKIINNEEIIRKKGMTKKQFEEKLINAVRNEFVSGYGDINDWGATQGTTENESKKIYQEQYNKTISGSNCNADIQMMYLDESGKINVVAKIYSLAGADYYYHIVNLDDSKNVKTSEELVTDAYTYNGTTKDGNNTSVSYKIPKININSSDVTKINNEINDKITSEAKKLVSEINNGSSPWIYKIFYNYYINDNILSIIIESDYDSNSTKANFVYNIDKNTGKSISNEEIMKKKNMTKEQFSKQLQISAGNKFIEKYGDVNEWLKTSDGSKEEQKKEYQSAYNKTTSSSNCSVDNQNIYLDANGKINVIAKIYSLAGADYYYHIVNIQ